MKIILVDDGSADCRVFVAERYRERFTRRGWRYYEIADICGIHDIASRGRPLRRGN